MGVFFSLALKARRESRDHRVTQENMAQTMLMGSKEMPALKGIKEMLGFQGFWDPKTHQKFKGLLRTATVISV